MDDMRYDGYNGQISIQGDALVLSREGLGARASGLSGAPRAIPFGGHLGRRLA